MCRVMTRILSPNYSLHLYVAGYLSRILEALQIFCGGWRKAASQQGGSYHASYLQMQFVIYHLLRSAAEQFQSSNLLLSCYIPM